jgi:hypothetical protein
MSMKRFVILFTLIAFSVASCAGPTTVGGKKDNFGQDQYREYQRQHIESSDNSPTFWQTLRGLVSYKENPDIHEPMSIDEILLIPVMVAVQLTGLAIGIVARGGGHI